MYDGGKQSVYLYRRWESDGTPPKTIVIHTHIECRKNQCLIIKCWSGGTQREGKGKGCSNKAEWFPIEINFHTLEIKIGCVTLQLWKYLDSEVAMTPMPPEYSEYKATILCKDCHKVHASTLLHFSLPYILLVFPVTLTITVSFTI